MIDLTFIGTAALMPLPERALCSVFLKIEGHSILFDCGEGTQSAAKKAGVSLMKTDIIALSHYHGDHIFGLPGLLQTMNVMGRLHPIYLIGPGNIEKELAATLALIGETEFEIKLISLPEEGLKLSTLVEGFSPFAALKAFRTEHRVESQGYVFTLSRAGKFLPEKAKALGVPVTLWSTLQKGESVCVGGATIVPDDVMSEKRKGLSVAYTGDTRSCVRIVEAVKGVDLLISEATFSDDDQLEKAEERGHMTFRKAAQLAKSAEVKSLCLTHFSPRVVNPAECLSNASAVFENTVCAEDGMKISLKFEE